MGSCAFPPPAVPRVLCTSVGAPRHVSSGPPEGAAALATSGFGWQGAGPLRPSGVCPSRGGSLEWGYQFHPGWYVLFEAPLCLPAVWRVGDAYASCGSLSLYCAMTCMPFGEPLSEELACPQRTCWYLPPASPFSAALAQRSRCCVAGHCERGLFPISISISIVAAPLHPNGPCPVRVCAF